MFSGDKNRNKKNIEKLRFFQREKSIVLVKNLKLFHLSIFGKIRQENVFDDILERKKAFLDYKKQKVKKVKKKSGFFQRGKSMALVKNWKFFHLFIFGKIRKENVFDNILERKKVFYTIKNKKLKSPKIGIFPKGLLHGFGQKFEFFFYYYYWQNQPAKCV